MESLRKLDSVIEYDYYIDTYQYISTVIFFVPYSPFGYKKNAVNIDSYYIASNTAYLKSKEYAQKLCEMGIECTANPHSDYKECAYRCGCGKGLNTLIYTKNMGSRFVIGALRLAKPLPPKKAEEVQMPCKDCGICAKACPLSAISDKFDRNKCMREYMQKPDKADEKVLNAFECRLLGCDICQKVCPLNKDTYIDIPLDIVDFWDIEKFYDILKEKLLDKFAKYFGKNYAVNNTLLALLLIVAGNSGDKKYIDIVSENLTSESDRVKFAAKYAIKKLTAGGKD